MGRPIRRYIQRRNEGYSEGVPTHHDGWHTMQEIASSAANQDLTGICRRAVAPSTTSAPDFRCLPAGYVSGKGDNSVVRFADRPLPVHFLSTSGICCPRIKTSSNYKPNVAYAAGQHRLQIISLFAVSGFISTRYVSTHYISGHRPSGKSSWLFRHVITASYCGAIIIECMVIDCR